MSFENKLLKMKGLLKAKPQAKKQTAQRIKPAHEALWRTIGLELVENDFGFVYKKTIQYPVDYMHGSVSLSRLASVLENWGHSEAAHPFRLSSEDRLLFFDTETTGLSGTGAYIFLAGILERTEQGFELIQYVLPDPSNETAFLYETKLWQDGQAVIFSYNGKSFDWPQLLSRWTLSRHALPPLPELRQIDLLHGTRRIWKNELERLKLSTVEEQKLGLVRTGDVPGHLIPPIYLDAVKNGEAESLGKVLFHNELDILSLVSLYITASDLLIEDLDSETKGAYTNIGKWYADLKEYDKSASFLEHVTQERGEAAAPARYLLAVQKKRDREFDTALRLFKEAAPNLRGPMEVEAWVHAAKLYEHQLGNIEQALIMTRLAKEAGEHTEIRDSLQADIQKREQRLLNKQRKKQDFVQDR